MSGFSNAVGAFFIKIGKRVEVPSQIIIEHLIVTIESLLGIWVIERVLRLLGLGAKPIPFTNFPLAVLMFGLEVFAATVIISIGIFKAARELLK